MLVQITYYDCTNLLDKFGDGDDTALEALSESSFKIDAGTAFRFYSKVEEVYKKRKQTWLDKFQRSFQFLNFKTEEDFEIALRNGKKNLSPLSKFVVLKAFPDDLRKTLKEDLEYFVTEIKSSIKSNVSKSTSHTEKMIILLNTFNLIHIPEEIKQETKNNKQNKIEKIQSKGRNILFSNGK